MEVVSLCPFRTAGLVWQPRPSAFSLLVVCKGTFELTPGVARLAEVQDYPNEEDNYWDDDPHKSLYSATDLVPVKPRADVLLVGHGFAPYGHEVPSFITRLTVGDLTKAIECVAERAWTAEPKVRHGSRITKASLRYERAGGGDGTANPVGVPAQGPADAFGMVPLPALQPPGFTLARRGDPVPTAGYGPIAPQWPTRTQKLGRHAATLHSARWHLAPLPTDLDLSYFNVAPEDQQLVEIRADERIELIGLHPDIPQLVTTLPGLHPRVFVERPSRTPEEVLMRGDTLWIDTDRQVVTVTWRGQVALASSDEEGRVLVAMEPPGRTLSFLDIDRLLGRSASAPASAAEDSLDSSIEWIEPEESAPADRASGGGAAVAVPSVPAPAPLLTFPAPAVPMLGVLEPPLPLSMPPAAQTTPTVPSGAPTESDPGASGARAGAPSPSGDLDRDLPTGERPARPAHGREGVHLLWLDDAADAIGARLGAGSARGALLSPRTAIAGASASHASAPGSLGSPRSLAAALDAAIGQDGRFEPPAVLLTGDLSLTLAPLDRLRALLTIAAVLEPADERASGLRSRGERLLTGPSPEGASWLAGRIADDLEAALAGRAGAPDSLAGARRALHATRSYARAVVLGGRHARGLLRDAGGAILAAYLPEAACAHLPLDERFRARVLGELHPRIDATDPAPFALRIVAVARVVTLMR